MVTFSWCFSKCLVVSFSVSFVCFKKQNKSSQTWCSRSTEWERLEETTGGHLNQPPCSCTGSGLKGLLWLSFPKDNLPCCLHSCYFYFLSGRRRKASCNLSLLFKEISVHTRTAASEAVHSPPHINKHYQH